MQQSDTKEPIRKRGFRPLCPCFEGGEAIDGFKHGKAKRKKQNLKAKRDQGKDSRKRKARREAKAFDFS